MKTSQPEPPSRGTRGRTSWGPVFPGLGLAVVCVVAAVLKWWLAP